MVIAACTHSYTRRDWLRDTASLAVLVKTEADLGVPDKAHESAAPSSRDPRVPQAESLITEQDGRHSLFPDST